MGAHRPLAWWHRGRSRRSDSRGLAPTAIWRVCAGATARSAPNCQSTSVLLTPPTNGVSRKTANRTTSERRVWKCGACKRQFSVLTNTIMHATKILVRMSA